MRGDCTLNKIKSQQRGSTPSSPYKSALIHAIFLRKAKDNIKTATKPVTVRGGMAGRADRANARRAPCFWALQI